MKLDLNEVASHLGKRISFDIDEPPVEYPESGLKCVEPIKGKISFSNTGSVLVVRGEIRTTLEVECARCLRGYRVDVEAPIEESFQIHGAVPEMVDDQEIEELLEDETAPLFQDNVLDLTELLRQSILLLVPIKPICSEDCGGLCPTCGRNLNDGPCGCPPESGESAFAGLASLLEEIPDIEKED